MRTSASRVILAAAMLGLAAGPAMAGVTSFDDGAGRTVTVDVRVPGADVAGYAGILRSAVHGPEMQGLTLRVTSVAAVRRACSDARAVGCYSRGRAGSVITIPARPAARVRATLLHEYGHHVDAALATPAWWAARGMASRLRKGQVAVDYSKGWSRAVGEIFAEDYLALHMKRRSAITWLPAPSARVLAALRRDIANGVDGSLPAPAPGTSPPVAPGSVVARATGKGSVGRGQVLVVAVPLARAGLQVRAVIRADSALGEVPLSISFTCDGMTPLTHSASPGETAYLRAGPVGPGTCTVQVTGPSSASGGAAAEVVASTGAASGG